MKLSVTNVVIAVYLLAVVVCVFLAFDFKGDINPTWTLVLIALTLPWSLVSIIFTWSLIHGAGLGCFTVMYLAFAGMNAYAIHFISSGTKKAKEANKRPDEDKPPDD